MENGKAHYFWFNVMDEMIDNTFAVRCALTYSLLCVVYSASISIKQYQFEH